MDICYFKTLRNGNDFKIGILPALIQCLSFPYLVRELLQENTDSG